MNNTIFLPNSEQTAKLLEDAWKSFKKKAAESGMELDINPDSETFAKEMFICGYCYGHNDLLEIIKGQIKAINLVNGIFN